MFKKLKDIKLITIDGVTLNNGDRVLIKDKGIAMVYNGELVAECYILTPINLTLCRLHLTKKELAKFMKVTLNALNYMINRGGNYPKLIYRERILKLVPKHGNITMEELNHGGMCVL